MSVVAASIFAQSPLSPRGRCRGVVALLLAVNLDGKAVDVNGGSHHGVVSTPAGAA